MSEIKTYDPLGQENGAIVGVVLSSMPVNGGPLYEASVRLQNGTVVRVLVKPSPVLTVAE